MTREELVLIKVCQGLAKAKGLVQETSFASFQSDFERENARRAKAVTEKEVIYGPRQYREASFITMSGSVTWFSSSSRR